jgi:hypothetical protein
MESCGARFGGEKAPGLVPANSPSPPRLCAVQVGASIALDRLTLAHSLPTPLPEASPREQRLLPLADAIVHGPLI